MFNNINIEFSRAYTILSLHLWHHSIHCCTDRKRSGQIPKSSLLAYKPSSTDPCWANGIGW